MLLNRTNFDELFASQQPALLISDALNGLMPQTDRHRRDEELLGTCVSSVVGW